MNWKIIVRHLSAIFAAILFLSSPAHSSPVVVNGKSSLWNVSDAMCATHAAAAFSSGHSNRPEAESPQVNLNLAAPEYKNCGGVVVNGGVSGPNPTAFLEWDWGDGTVTHSFFPAFHVYASDGTFTLSVTSVSDICETKTVTVQIEVTSTGGVECPAERSQCAYLKPSGYHLTAGSTAPDPLRVVDHAGNPVSGDLTIGGGYDSSLISISEQGNVTGLRTEAANEIGTWVFAGIDNKPVASGSVVRVLSQDYGIPLVEALTDNTALVYPASAPNFSGNLQEFVANHEIPAVNEYAYQIERDLLSLNHFLDGCRQVYVVDFGETEQQRVCGLSGNPVRLGWNIQGETYQNCFSGPHWFVFYHELGHNVTFSTPVFGQVFGRVVHYIEGLASVPSVVAMEDILNNTEQYPLGTVATDSLQNELNTFTDVIVKNSYENWVGAGARIENLDANIVDGIWLEHKNSDAYAKRFHDPLAPRNAIELCPVWSQAKALGDAGAHTFFAALVSAAADEDLSKTFSESYNYPINQEFFDTAYARFLQIIEGHVFDDGFEAR